MSKSIAIKASILTAIVVLATGGIAAACSQQEKKNICHKTEGESSSWQAIRVNASAYDSHLEHGDFDYRGPTKDNGKPTKDGDTWCQENQPQQEPTPCRYNPQLNEDDQECIPPIETPPVEELEPQPTQNQVVTADIEVDVPVEVTEGK